MLAHILIGLLSALQLWLTLFGPQQGISLLGLVDITFNMNGMEMMMCTLKLSQTMQ
jgi:hypothetical protein